MARIRTLNFLPEVFQTPINKQFLSATLDQIVNDPITTRVQGYIGNKFGPGVKITDSYINEPTKVRNNYQLEPGVIFTKNDEKTAKDFISYPEIISALNVAGGITDNHNRLFNSDIYSWDSFVDLDKLVNYHEYYWLENGPPTVTVSPNEIFTNVDYNVFSEPNSYRIRQVGTDLDTGSNPVISLLRGGTYKFIVNQNTQFWIQTEPDNSGLTKNQPFVSSREVFGVSNNGASQGIVTFNVPFADAQDDFIFNDTINIDLVTTLTFDQVNGRRLNDVVDPSTGQIISGVRDIDGVTGIDGLRIMFFNSLPGEIGYISSYFDEMFYDINDDFITSPRTVVANQTSSTSIFLAPGNTTASLIPNQTITIISAPMGGLEQGKVYFVKDIISATEFTISETLGGPIISIIPQASGTMTLNINQGQYEQGFYTTVNENFYRVQLIGDPANPIIRLLPDGIIPQRTNIVPRFGREFINRKFYRNDLGIISLVPLITAPLSTLYYVDGSNPNRVGIIKIVENNGKNFIDVEEEILGKPTYTSPNGVTFTNGLKVTFDGNIFPETFRSNTYYVENVGTGIQLIDTRQLESPESFTVGEFSPFDTARYDLDSFDISLNLPIEQDYITIARNSIARDAWTRSNRWFHGDVIRLTAKYNKNSSILDEFLVLENKAKRPIIEFKPNLKLFNSGVEGKDLIDFFDIKATDALSEVAGKVNYYPDAKVYTKDDATIVSTPITIVNTSNVVKGTSYLINNIAGTTQATWNIIAGTTGITYQNGDRIVAAIDGSDIVTPGTGTLKQLYNTVTITIPSNSISGNFEIGMFVGDTKDILPNDAQIVDITEVGNNIQLTVVFSFAQEIIGDITSIAASDVQITGQNLFTGARIIFANDQDATTRSEIYVVRRVLAFGSNKPVITLTKASDGTVLPGQQVTIKRGVNNKGCTYYYDGIKWKKAQQKLTVNQAPLFDLFDKNGTSLSDSSVYNGSSFKGTTLFSYGINPAGVDDPILGFPLRFSDIGNIGDISFDVTINSDIFEYTISGKTFTEKVNNLGYVHQYNSLNEYTRLIGWQPANDISSQYLQFNFDYSENNTYVCDVVPVNQDTVKWPVLKVFVNSEYQTEDKYTVSYSQNSTTVTLLSNVDADSIIQIFVLSDQISEKGYYTVPDNLANNPFNTDLSTVDLGDIKNHYKDIFINSPNLEGNIFGINNYRDSGNLTGYGTKIIKNSASLVLPGLFLRNQDFNIINALTFSSREYVKYKQMLVNLTEESNYFDEPTNLILDKLIEEIAANKSEINSFFWSDMVPNKTVFSENVYVFNSNVDITRYPLHKVYDFTKASYDGVLVYLRRNVGGRIREIQLLNNVDYIISSESPSLTVIRDLQPGDNIIIKEYNQTFGSYVPYTPSKLGLYPLYVPEVVLDNNYITPTYFIKGHDGSYTKLYGEYDPILDELSDLRDRILLEFEKRIYNNVKLPGQVFDIYDIIPGFFRKTDFSYEEWLTLYSANFLDWIGQNRLDFTRQFYNLNNEFTYNYTNTTNKINNERISQGNFRGIYQYFYDTFTPNLTPWEMLGFSNKPSWWEDRYGPAPYTSDNLILWEDIEKGIIYDETGNFTVNKKFARPGLSSIIPVDEDGNLKSPLQTLVSNYNVINFQKDWKVGDVGPVELSYRRSSTYPFDLMKIFSLVKPAMFYNLAVDVDEYKFNKEFNQYLVNDRTHLDISKIKVYGDGTPKTSFLNWVVDYAKQFGVSVTSQVLEAMKNLDVRLVYRMAGFSDKTLLKFFVEKNSPSSRNSSLLIPGESLSVLLHENQPFDKLVYSSVIVQKLNNGGYSVYGNSQTNAFFKVFKPVLNSNTRTIEVVNQRVSLAKDYTTQEMIVPYGTVFNSVQDLSQFLMNYDAYLRDKGVRYEQVIDGNEVDWLLMVKQFLYWTQLGWEPGSIITLNPLAVDMTINKSGSVVQPLTISQQNFILNQDLYPIQINNLCITRDGTEFKVHTLNEGDTMSFATFNISNIEHGVVFDNITLFGDVIYNLTTGLRQNRLLALGIKTANWNGTVNSWGFILSQDNITEWSNNVKYPKGAIVKYKNNYYAAKQLIQPSSTFDQTLWTEISESSIQLGMLPNSATRAYESTLYYNTDRANLDVDADLLSYSLIGYRPRDYMSLANLTSITEINVYKNMIKTKGTIKSLKQFDGVNLAQGSINYELYENWAIKTGEYGGRENDNFVEFNLNKELLTNNPSIVSLTNGTFTLGSNQEVPLTSLLNYKTPIDDPDILPVKNNIGTSIFPYAGYVNFNDVKMSSFFYSGLKNAVNKENIIVPITDFYVRDYMWLANFKEQWGVFTWKPLGAVIEVIPNVDNTSTITFDVPHNLKAFDPIAIVNFSNNVDGYYIVSRVVSLTQVIINLSIPVNNNRVLTGNGVGLLITSQRVKRPSDIGDLNLLEAEFIKNTVWVDENTDGNWAVYRKTNNYVNKNTVFEDNTIEYGKSLAFTKDVGYLVSDPAVGKVYRYSLNIITGQYEKIQEISNAVSFGETIAQVGNLFAISEPATPKLYLYSWNQTITTNDLFLYQQINLPNIGAGTAVEFSHDGNWLFVNNPGNVTVNVYRKSNIEVTAPFIQAGRTYVIDEVGNTNFMAIGAQENRKGIIFVATGTGTGNGKVTDISYDLISIVNGALDGFVASDSFGKAIATDLFGEKLVISAPNVDFNTEISDWGKVLIYQRATQTFEVQTNSITDRVQEYNLGFTVNTVSSNVISTNAAGNIVTVADASSFIVGAPIIFRGTGLLGTNIVPNITYYINTIVGNNITLKLSRNSNNIVQLATKPGITNVTAVCQNERLLVSVNGKIVQDNNYAAVGNIFIYSGEINAGDILKVDGNQFFNLQTLTSNSIERPNHQYGFAIDMNNSGNELLVGSPFEVDSNNREGQVYRYTNIGSKFGIVVGNSECNITTNRKIYINGYEVLLRPGNAEVNADIINSYKITNVMASYTSDNRLIIQIINQDLAQINRKLVVTAFDKDALNEAGIELMTETQKITCPHSLGPTQFGSTIKFNERNSVVIGAPSASKVLGTVFDFSDNENLDDDTVFDNNATRFVEEFPNYGAAYMFDLLEDFNGGIDKPGKFVYAQPVNNIDTNYSLSPRYGSAIAFNDNVVIVSAPHLNNTTTSRGAISFYENVSGQQNWSVFRSPVKVVDIEKIQNAQIFSSVTNNTLRNLDYIDPLQGKILGAARENIDFISNVDPANYNTDTFPQKTWGEEEVGSIWLDTTNLRFVDYRQNDIVYNSEYWGHVFPGSEARVFTWVKSNIPPNQYQGPGIVYDNNKFVVSSTLNSSNIVTPVYYFWVRNTGNINIDRNKNLSDITIEYYVQNPKNSGIPYLAPLLPNTFALYNAEEEINAAGAALHIGYALSDTMDFSHTEFVLIRENNETDFLSGLPGVRNRPAVLPNRVTLPGPGEKDEPTGLYLKLLDSLSGVNSSGQIVPDPFLPPLFQTGVLNRPRQSFFFNRLVALQNYLTYANNVLKKYPITEIRTDLSFLFLNNEFYDTTDYWEYINWWAPGYDDSTRASFQVRRYADLFSLTVAPETLVKVEQNGRGLFEIYKLERSGVWSRVGLEKGTIKFSDKLWNYFDNNIGYSVDFFDIQPYDSYPSDETRNIIRALNEQIFIDDLSIHKNNSLILLFEYIVSEATERKNNLSWLNKTSLVEVKQNVRKLLPFEILRSDNEEFLRGYIEEVKPYHVTIKEFLLSYNGNENFVGDISDFDLPAKFNSSIGTFITPNLVNGPGNDITNFGYNSNIWNDPDYKNWFTNTGLSISGLTNFNIGELRSYIDVSDRTLIVDNAAGFPASGIITIGEEKISYSTVNRDKNELGGLSRGLFGTIVQEHIPGEKIFIDLPPVIVLNEGSGYTNIPKVTAYIDTSIYPPPRVEAEFQAVLSGNKVTEIRVINPGEGYMICPEIIVEPAYVITFSTVDINSDLHTINVFAPNLKTGDIVKFKKGSNGVSPAKLVDNEWYYVGVLETLPSVVIALYNTASEAINDQNRIEIQALAPSNDMKLLPGCRASAIVTSEPVRENNIKIRLDRTSYTSQVKDWEAEAFYGGFFAGDFYNSERISSSSITLQNTIPDINDILTSSAGIVFEIQNVNEEVILTYSSFPRFISRIHGLDNTIELIPQDGNNPDLSELADNASGTTIGFYKNMPIYFSGAGPAEIIENQTYYVSRIFDDLRFTISATVDGPEVNLNDFIVSAQGYRCFTGQNNSTTILTLKYPDIHQVTKTEAGTNKLTVPITKVGTGGTFGFYTNLPIFFTDNAFGNVVENLVYYVTTVIDEETFTMSETKDPVMANAIQTNSGSNTVTLTSVEGFSKNDPIIFTNIDGLDSTIIAGKTYYIGEVLSGNRISIAEFLNGPTILLSNSTGTALVTNQKGTVKLANATGSMTMNVQLPVSPGQIDKQLFTFYNSSGITPGVISENYSNLIVRNNIITVGTKFGEAVNRIYLPIPIERGTSNFYVNMPVTVSANIGNLIAGTTYYVIKFSGMEDPLNPGTTIPNAIVEVISSVDSTNVLNAVYDPANGKLGTAVLYENMPLRFKGPGLGNIDINIEYYVKQILSITEFTISTTPDGPEFDLSNAAGNLIGVGDPYVVVSTTPGGPVFPLSNSTVTTLTSLNQVILQAPSFDISSVAGGYVVRIANSGLGFAKNNVITISGSIIGGTTPDNDLALIVNSIGPSGQITSVIKNGIPAGDVKKYYLKVRSPNKVEVYKNSILTVPVSKSEFSYTGYVTTIVNGSTTDTLLLNTTNFSNFDPVVFTGNVPTAIDAGKTYYLYNITPTTAQITEIPNEPSTLVTGINFISEFTMSKLGSVAILPEPFFFNQSIVRFNNRLYVCAISNNDKEFVIGKWELLDPSDRRLNAMDRALGYYQPTDDMPAVDLPQLFEGVTYPKPVYRANEFEPNNQFDIDTVLTTIPFAQVDIDIKGILYDNGIYLAIASLENGTGVFTSTDLTSWALKRLTNADIELTGIFNINGIKLITSSNNITPIFKSEDNNEWTSTGYYIPGTGLPLAIDISNISLNAATYYDAQDLYIMVGENIVTSSDYYVWADRTNFDPVLSYNLKDVVSTPNYVVAVGKGKRITETQNLVDTGLIFYSVDGINWQEITIPINNGFNAIAFNGNKLVAVGEQETIFTSVDGINWVGVNNVSVVFVNDSTNIINVDNTLGFIVGTPVVFNNSFSTIVSGVTYYIVQIVSDTQLRISDILSGPVKNLTSEPVPEGTRMTVVSNNSVTLNKLIFANNIWIAVGNNGIVKTSVDGNIWNTTQVNSLTVDLLDITFNDVTNEFIIVGGSNTLLISNDNGVTWTETSIINAEQTTYIIKGTDFNFGYAPEELVAGVVKDNLSIISITRPGSNWQIPEYGHSGFNVKTIIHEAEFEAQTIYSFNNVVQIPAKIIVQIIDGSTGLAYTIYEGISYQIDWVNKKVILNSPLRQLPVKDKLLITVYEIGNGHQIVKSSTDILPIRTNSFSGFNEIYLGCNYTGQIFEGSGAIRPGTSTLNVRVFRTESLADRIFCDSVDDFVLSAPITFQGQPFGGLQENTVYYVKSISFATNSITVSDNIDPNTGLPGPTITLTDATGQMFANIESGAGEQWSPTVVLHNGVKLISGETGLITQSYSIDNSIVTTNTGNLVTGMPITFCQCQFGVLEPLRRYYVKDVLSSRRFTISETLGGPVVPQIDFVGLSTYITNDFAIGRLTNNQASLVFSRNDYTTDTDYIVFSIFGEELTEEREYSLPETEIFIGDGLNSKFFLKNFVGAMNPKNAIVELNGVRLTSALYQISEIDNSILLNSPPLDGDILAVTTFNDTNTQYLNTQFDITGNPDSTLLNLVVVQTINKIGTFDQNNPVLQTFDQNNPDIVTYDEFLNYLVLGTGNTGSINVNDSIMFNSPTIGGLIPRRIYYVKEIINSTTFTVSEEVAGDTTVVYNDTGSMTGLANGLLVNEIVNVDGNISSPFAVTNAVSTTAGAPNKITVQDITGFVVGQTVQFFGTSFDNNIKTDGTVYFIATVDTINSSFTIVDYDGNQIVTAGGAGLMRVVVGDRPTVRITTDTEHGFLENTLVRIDGVSGSTQLNNNTYYAKIINPTTFDIYNQPYDPSLNATNDPVTVITAYTGGGFAWRQGLFFLQSNKTSETFSDGRIFVDRVDNLVVNTPVYFNKVESKNGDVLLGGLVQGREYFIVEIDEMNKFIRVSDTRNGVPLSLTADTSETIGLIQWSHKDVDRIYVTINGFRVPSDKLRINEVNEVSILAKIVPGDQVIITSMIPTATPNRTQYINIVNGNNSPSVYRIVQSNTTWLSQDLSFSDNTMVVNDISKLVTHKKIITTAPALVDGVHKVGLDAEKNSIVSITVNNITKGQVVGDNNYKLIIDGLTPTLRINPGTYISQGDQLVIDILEGSPIYVNGEIIKFTEVDLTNNTLSGLSRGVNGTAQQTIIPKYTNIYSLSNINKLPDTEYNVVWNSNIYNQTLGDPLQFSDTEAASFLNDKTG
jgi:hypothetical protein